LNETTFQPWLSDGEAPIAFHKSSVLPCPYLPGRAERRIVAELTPAVARAGAFDALTAVGFRRSHGLMYRPACPSCSACVPVRVVVERFQARRTLQRTWRDNADLTAAVVAPRATVEQYRLFHAYQLARHRDGDMALMDFVDYRALVEESPVTTHLLELRDAAGALIACCLFDGAADGPSAVYSFFADLPERSLGSLIVLWLIEHARAAGQPYVYLGYWIEACRKMAYKVRFRPVEALGPVGWQPIDPAPPARAADPVTP